MAAEAQKKTGRWIKIALAVSLALNLLVVGVVAGAALSGGKWRDHAPHRLAPVGGPLTRALTEEDRHAIGRAMREARRGDRSRRRDHRAAFDALLVDLRAVPFDRSETEARLEEISTLVQQRLALGQGLLLDQLENMSDAERAAYADRLQEVRKKRRH